MDLLKSSIFLANFFPSAFSPPFFNVLDRMSAVDPLETLKKGGMPMVMKDGKKIPAFAAKKGGMPPGMMGKAGRAMSAPSPDMMGRAMAKRPMAAEAPMMNKGGIILSDNVLWSGKVLEPISEKDTSTKILVEYNKLINEDSRVETVLLPIRDGLTVTRVL